MTSENRLLLAIALGVGAIGSMVLTLRTPTSYEDCILAYVPRNSGPAVGQIVKACRDKFPLDFSAYAADPNAKSQ